MEDIGHLVKNQFARNRNNIGRVRRRDGVSRLCLCDLLSNEKKGGREKEKSQGGVD